MLSHRHDPNYLAARRVIVGFVNLRKEQADYRRRSTRQAVIIFAFVALFASIAITGQIHNNQTGKDLAKEAGAYPVYSQE